MPTITIVQVTIAVMVMVWVAMEGTKMVCYTEEDLESTNPVTDILNINKPPSDQGKET